MNIVKSFYKALYMTPWFIKESWSYIVIKHWSSKIEFFVGLIPAWYRFTVLTYKDHRRVK